MSIVCTGTARPSRAPAASGGDPSGEDDSTSDEDNESQLIGRTEAPTSDEGSDTTLYLAIGVGCGVLLLVVSAAVFFRGRSAASASHEQIVGDHEMQHLSLH